MKVDHSADFIDLADNEETDIEDLYELQPPITWVISSQKPQTLYQNGGRKPSKSDLLQIVDLAKPKFRNKGNGVHRSRGRPRKRTYYHTYEIGEPEDFCRNCNSELDCANLVFDTSVGLIWCLCINCNTKIVINIQL